MAMTDNRVGGDDVLDPRAHLRRRRAFHDLAQFIWGAGAPPNCEDQPLKPWIAEFAEGMAKDPG